MSRLCCSFQPLTRAVPRDERLALFSRSFEIGALELSLQEAQENTQFTIKPGRNSKKIVPQCQFDLHNLKPFWG